MPSVKLTEVVTFSSEDPNHPADNLLRPDAFRKWKVAAGTSDKQSSVILKLERLTSVNSIDIGNDGSAFIEVLVGREGVADFQVLLVASSFMTPIESRNGSDLHRVRMFGFDKLNKNVAEQKWDRVKVICTQPFNKKMQYGLSFITVRAPDLGGETKVTTPKITKLGSFTLKEEDDEDPISVGSLFARRKDKEPSSPLSGAAAIRAASMAAAAASSVSPSHKPDTQPSSLKRKTEDQPTSPGFYQLKKKAVADQNSTEKSKEKKVAERGKEERSNNSKLERKPDTPKPSKPTGERKNGDKGEKSERKERSEKDERRVKSEKNERREKGERSEKGEKKEKNEKVEKKSCPFAALMQDVVFVLSGYQNPERSQLRDAMVDMGATYKGDWGPSCTHLICAFKNTPKFQQVRGKGRIMNGNWVTQCHKDMKRYPGKRFELETRRGGDQDEEEEEVWAKELLPNTSKPTQQQRPSHIPSPQPGGEEDVYGVDADTSENEDTDDEIERAKARRSKEAPQSTNQGPSSKYSEPTTSKETPNSKSSKSTERTPGGGKRMAEQNGEASRRPAKKGGVGRSDDATRVNGGAGLTDDEVYDDDTDVDEENGELLLPLPDTTSLPLPALADYFRGKCFLLYGSMGAEERQLLHRYIIAFHGEMESYMSDKVQYVISEDSWDDKFDEALNDHPSLQFVKPMWVWRCCDKQRLLPHQPYLIVPRE